jgi:glycosyltransferase involved in cell wall biosynthesis
VDLDGFLWARRRRLPFVVSLKGVIADELKNERGWVRVLLAIQARWERLNARRADIVIAPSRYSADVARREYGVAAEKIAVVPEPIELERWTSLFAAAAPQPRGGPSILCVARLYPRKRIGDLLEAAALLRHRIPGARVRIVGKGPEWDGAVRLHAALGLGETVTLLGDVSRDRLAGEYVGADIFCLPSVQESFGIVFLEAMAAGLPVVAAGLPRSRRWSRTASQACWCRHATPRAWPGRSRRWPSIPSGPARWARQGAARCPPTYPNGSPRSSWKR